MIPSNKWFPQSLQERAAWYDNFATQFAALGITLVFKAVDVTSVANDNAVMQFVANAAVTLEAYKDAVRQYRIVITEGNIGDQTPIFPADISLATPGLVTTGIFERLDDFVKRIRVSPDYTPEIGAIFDIIPSSPTPTPEGDLKPVIKASESFGGYKFDVNVTRLGTEAFKVQVQKNGNGNWADAAFATNNPVEVTVTPATPGQPERILVRAILLQKNQPVGQPSDPTYVTVNP
ncbi:MAG: hypothetical protein ACT4O9_15810 [Blastocatellia bacterium]